VIINKCDLNAIENQRIQTYCKENGLPVFAQLPYSPLFTQAMVQGKAITECQNNGVAGLIKAAWSKISAMVYEVQRQ
jgi:MinD superfamily P-loop ATPase